MINTINKDKLKIAVDIGHGEHANSYDDVDINQDGKIDEQEKFINEADEMWRQAVMFKSKIEREYENVEVVFTKPDAYSRPDWDVRAKATIGADLMLSFHNDYSSNKNVRGVHIFDDVAKEYENPVLANLIIKKITEKTGLPIAQGGYHQARREDGTNAYAILKFSKAKSNMMLEIGFHSNTEDIRIIVLKMELIVDGIIEAVAEFYQLSPKAQPKTQTLNISRTYRFTGAIKSNGQFAGIRENLKAVQDTPTFFDNSYMEELKDKAHEIKKGEVVTVIAETNRPEMVLARLTDGTERYVWVEHFE